MGFMLLRSGQHGIHFYPPAPGEMVSLAGGDPVVWDGRGVVMASVSALIEIGVFYNLDLKLYDSPEDALEKPFYLFGHKVEIINYSPQLDAVYLIAIQQPITT